MPLTSVSSAPSAPASCASRARRSSRTRPPACRRRSACRSTKKSGSRPHAAVQPPGPTQIVWVSSITSSVPVRRVISRSASWKPGSGSDDADVGERRLGQHARDVARRQRGFERVDVVELDDLGRDRRVDRRSDVAGTRRTPAAVEDAERLVDGAVVAPVEDEDLGPPGDVAGEPQHEPVGVGRGHRDLPERQPEASRAAARRPTIASSVGSIVVMPRRACAGDRVDGRRAASGRSSRPVSPRQKST